MTNPGNLEAWLDQAKNNPWGFLAALQQPGLSKEQTDAIKARAAEDEMVVARAWKDFAGTPGGLKALQRLMDQTLNRAVPPAVSLGLSLEQTALYAQFREGQNNVAQMIVKFIAKGRDPEDQPKTRETP